MFDILLCPLNRCEAPAPVLGRGLKKKNTSPDYHNSLANVRLQLIRAQKCFLKISIKGQVK